MSAFPFRLCRLTALASVALRGNRGHFDPRLFAAKPHAGQNEAAAWIYGDLRAGEQETIRLQDRYSIRCAPHVIGVARDALGWMRRDIEKALAEPDVQEKFKSFGYEPFTTTRPQFAQFVKDESQRFADVIKKANVSLD